MYSKILSIFLVLFITFFQAQELKMLDLSEVTQQLILEDKLEENSGLEFIDGYIYTFNDSGGEAAVYKVDIKSGKVVQTLVFEKVKNVDFEDIAYDGKNIYIGDFGNNLGNRDEKYIYVFNIENIDSNAEYVSLTPSKLTFEIEEEKNEGKVKPHSTNFDVESLLYHNDQLHIFTKEWTNAKTTHYTLNPHQTIQKAKKIEDFDTGCFITGADMINNTLVMTGYTRDGEVYLWRFTGFTEPYFFNGESQKYMLGLSPTVGQIEGISITEDKIFISGEKFSKFGFTCPQKIYILSIEEIQ